MLNIPERRSLVYELLCYFQEERWLPSRPQRPEFAQWERRDIIATVGQMCDDSLVFDLPEGGNADLRYLVKDNSVPKSGCVYLLTPLGRFVRDYARGQAQTEEAELLVGA